ncbi:MAG TPA: hypothetical protein VG839_02825 [Asticcacaulis sp.]|nr:hypothetical protein [Asticcacaulis sp.]
MSRDKKINVANGLVTQLRATEEAIDTALTEAAHLIETYITSRRAIRMSTVIAGDVHQNTLQAMLALNLAQQHMTAAHQGLARVQREVGLRPTDIIPPDDKPGGDDDGSGGGAVYQSRETVVAE